MLSTTTPADASLLAYTLSYMADAPKPSFIPKQAAGGVFRRSSRRGRHFNILGFVGNVFFLCGMILSVGVYLYQGWSEEALAEKKRELTAIQESFNKDDIASLRALDRRLRLSLSLLDAHLSPSAIFDALEFRTQRGVQFTDFSYQRRESGSVEIALGGVAERFNTVGLQSRQLADAQFLASVLFSDLAVDEDGRVRFSVTGEGDVAALAYDVPAAAPEDVSAMATTTPEAPSGEAPAAAAPPRVESEQAP